MPAEPEAERAILGSILLQNELIHQAAEMTRPEDYYLPTYRAIFNAMVELAESKSEITPILLGSVLRNNGRLESVGGMSSLLALTRDITHGLPGMSSIARYAKIVRGKALLRELIHEHLRGIDEAFEQESEPDVILDNAQRGLVNISVESRVMNGSARTYKEIGAAVGQMFDKWSDGHVIAVPTGIPEIDHKLVYGGLAYGDFGVLAAQTSYGKTAMSLQIALNASRSGVPVLIFSLEMNGERLFIRNLSSVSSVPRREITPYTFRHKHEETISRINSGRPHLESMPISVADRVRTLSRLSSVATDWKLRTCKDSGGLIIVDYMQLVQNRMTKRSREEEVAGVSRELKSLAATLDVPVLGLSQFNREPSRSNQRPELKDLRESGALEQDTDLALFIWSPNKMGEEPIRAVRVYCAKQRDGAVGWDEPIDFDAEHQWFRSGQMWRTDPVEEDWNRG